MVSQINENLANSSVQVNEVPKIYLEKTWNKTSRTNNAKMTIMTLSKNRLTLLKIKADVLMFIGF